MRRKANLPELLSPAGSMECLVAAIEAGADAVYIGGKSFGARAYAKNFEIAEIEEAVRYCHLFGARLYVTVNTLVDDKEMPGLLEYAGALYEVGVDALIVADLGVVRVLREKLPDFELHASTQMSIHNSDGVFVVESLGCSRAVVARELTLRDISEIVEDSPLEIEMFLHGAMCVSHSGQCLFSSLVGGRSGNRGECAQPCRLPYGDGKYPISLKDMCLAGHIPEIIDSGVASLKIEGRMKSAEYVYTVTKIYRRLLDERRSATEAEILELMSAFNRGGFTDGYLTGRIERGMIGVREAVDSLPKMTFEKKKKPLTAKARIVSGEPASLTLCDGEREVCALGEIPAAAATSPLTAESVCERLCKMGNTDYTLRMQNVELTLDDGLNLSPKSLNQLRREAVEMLSSAKRAPVAAEYSVSRSRFAAPAERTALFLDERAYLGYKKSAKGADGYFKIEFVPLFSSDEALTLSRGVYLPPVITNSEMTEVRAQLEKAKKLGVLYALVGNLSQIKLSVEFGFAPYGDFRLNVTNSHTRDTLLALGLKGVVLSPELTLPKARDIGGSVIVYGRVPLMLTERCFIKENFGCDRCGKACLTDRRGEKFPMMREYSHRNLILNSRHTYMGDRRGELSGCRLESHHFIFSTESAVEIASAIESFRLGKPLDGSEVRRVGRRKHNKK